MSDAVLIVLTTSVASIISIIISQLLASWIAKRKTDVDVGKIRSDTNLTDGDLVQKYQKIATDQADENIELTKKIKDQEAEKKELLTSMKQLRDEMLLLDNSHKEEIMKLKESFEEERKENALFRDWSRRLVLQLKSWDINPVPFDLKEAKEKGFSLGDWGKNNLEKSGND